MRNLLLTAMLVALVGCGHAPMNGAGKPATLADVGPAPVDPMLIVTSELKMRLKDPETARIELARPPRAVVMANSALVPGGAGWEICASVNAKNAFGGYTGYKSIFFLWNNGELLSYVDGDLGDAFCRDKNDYRLQVRS